MEETWLFESIEQPVPARQMPTESVPENVLLTADDLHISWQGDGKFLASSSRAAAGDIYKSPAAMTTLSKQLLGLSAE